MSDGYSGRPLVAKLGIKPGAVIAVIDAPPGYWELLEPLPGPIDLRPADSEKIDIIHFFVTERATLAGRLAALRRQISPAGMIWVSWPKRAAKLPTDLTEDVVRELALAHGLVDVKVCAIDATWSGLKLVIPLAQREK